MPKDTKKKANPALEDDNEIEEQDEATETETDEVEETEDTETETDEEEVEEEPVKKPTKASKTGKSSKAKTAKADEAEEDEDGAGFTRETAKPRGNSVEQAMLTDIAATKAKLAAQPKVRIFIPLGIGEKKGSKSAVETVTINGYRQVLPKGEYITVPQAVADLIEAHYNMAPENTEMGNAYRLDRPRYKDGMSTDEALM